MDTGLTRWPRSDHRDLAREVEAGGLPSGPSRRRASARNAPPRRPAGPLPGPDTSRKSGVARTDVICFEATRSGVSGVAPSVLSILSVAVSQGPAKPLRRRAWNRPSHPARTRTEKDSWGAIEVEVERLWGAQTERSRQNFRISGERMPRELVHALVLVKKAAALVHVELGLLDAAKGRAIVAAADEVLGGRWDGEFPLVVWQTGSGTQTNMNVNEVLANRASELLGGPRGGARCTRTTSRRTTPSPPRSVTDALRHFVIRRSRLSATRCARSHACRRRENRPHAPDGRDAAHARPGDLRLGQQRGVARLSRPFRAYRSWRSAARLGLAARPRVARLASSPAIPS